MTTALADLSACLEGAVRFDVPLADHTTYRIGGPAAALVEPNGAEDVARALVFVQEHEVPWCVLGLGSNVLVADAGFPGVVLRIGKGVASVQAGPPDGGEWRVGAGFPTPQLARRTADAGLSGVHRLIGVPGTVGGGVFMNAGAHGQEFRDVVRAVEVVTAQGTIETRESAALQWRYRSSGLKDVIVTAATLQFAPDDPERLKQEVARHLEWRKTGTPFSEACCGSVFRNPASPVSPSFPLSSGGEGGEGGEEAGGPTVPRSFGPPSRSAGQLIDAAGMKGFRIGGAQVSTLHANYIVNTGGATCNDVLRVIDAVRSKVLAEFGVELELEVQMVGG